MSEGGPGGGPGEGPAAGSGTGTTTVLFTDLVDSTGMRRRLGDEHADTLRRAHDRLLAGAIARHGGTVVKSLGDGVMATFAAAADAVRAGVDIQQLVHVQARSVPEVELAVRVGISSGDVVWEDGDCHGTPVIEAARLCGAATGGQIVVADVVLLLTRSRGGQQHRSLGALSLRGMDEPVPASAVDWEPLPSDRWPLPELLDAGSSLRFSGRQAEVETAMHVWKLAAEGSRQAILVSGEPGIGKTRLAREITTRAHEQGAIVLYGRCEEDLGAPYQPFVEALAFFASHDPEPALLGRFPGELARISAEVEERFPGLPPPLRSDAETERYRLFEAVASWLHAAGEPDGLVLVLDDLHWASRPTLLLLQHVLHATVSARLLIVGTYRDTDLNRTHPLGGLLADLRRSTGVTRTALSGLDRAGVGEMMAAAAGHPLDAAGEELADEIHAETEGNPFFVGEILRHLAESGAIYQRDGRWMSDRRAADLGIPEGIREVVGRRLDRLPEGTTDALAVAAVVGRDFDLDTVVVASTGDEDRVVAALDAAVDARLMRETGVGQYRFAHALVRDTLYAELSSTRRVRLHRRVAEHLERARPDDVAALAHHYTQAAVGDDVDKAVEYTRRAGDNAMVQLAHEEAVAWYQRAEDLLEGSENEPLRCDVLIACGEAQRRSGDPVHRDTLLRAARMARDLGCPDRLARATLANNRGFWSMVGQVDPDRIEMLEAALAAQPADGADRARLLVTLASELMFAGDVDRRYELSREAVEVARRIGDEQVLAEVLSGAIPSNLEPWALTDAGYQYAQELNAIADRIADPVRQAQAGLWTYSAYSAMGDVRPALPSFERALRLAEELGQPSLRWLTTVWTAFTLLKVGEVAAAEDCINRAFAIGTAAGEPDVFTWFAGQLFVLRQIQDRMDELVPLLAQQVESSPELPGWRAAYALVLAELGRAEEARPIVDKFVADDLAAVPRDVLWIGTVAPLGSTACRLGATEHADLFYRKVLPYRSQTVHVGVAYLGCAEYYLGELAMAMDRLNEADEHFAAADVAHADTPLWRARGRLRWAEMLRRRGSTDDRSRAEAMLVEVRSAAQANGWALLARWAEELG